MAGTQAVSANTGKVDGQLDSSLSVGVSWAIRLPAPDLTGVANVGKSESRTGDDGRFSWSLDAGANYMPNQVTQPLPLGLKAKTSDLTLPCAQSAFAEGAQPSATACSKYL